MKNFKEKQATSLKFSPEGDILLIGFHDGSLVVMELGIKKLPNF